MYDTYMLTKELEEAANPEKNGMFLFEGGKKYSCFLSSTSNMDT